ncbi:MAG: Fic family protein [Saprospiraceae bacterium]|nr:Fic family protein [Saprospiraceae bacterium]
MAIGAHFSHSAPVFHGRQAPESGHVVGYGAIIHGLGLSMPMPTCLALVSDRNRRLELDSWMILPSRYLPDDKDETDQIRALYNHLVFALKYEGVDLLFFSQLAKTMHEEEMIDLVRIEPAGQYSRRIWFLLEWVSETELNVHSDLKKRRYVEALNPKQQFGLSNGTPSPRHKVVDNIPGTPGFCPLVRCSAKLQEAVAITPNDLWPKVFGGMRPDLIKRSAALLLINDSKASFSIEGENPKSRRAALWGQAIGQAGSRPLSKEEFLRLQQLVIGSDRFVRLGYRTEGGFVGLHERETGMPIPDHISARWEDVETLMNSLVETYRCQKDNGYHAVLAAAVLAFGFVFIHPFVDGNGRIHRYLFHHILTESKFNPPGLVFPISASILDHLDGYRRLLEGYSIPLLDWIDWQPTEDNNVRVLNETADYYKYFDATPFAEFLVDCLEDTVNRIIPGEIRYLKQFDAFKMAIDDQFDLPNRLVDLLFRFLDQNGGKLSQRALAKEFSGFEDRDKEAVETIFLQIQNQVN